MSRTAVLARQQLAMRFQIAPADYAHRSWWPELFLSVFGAAVQPSAQAQVQLSAWMLEQFGLEGSVDLEFEPPAKRFWLLPAETIRRTALDLGVALHRNLIRQCVTRSSWQRLSSSFERDTITYALSDAAARLVPSSQPIEAATETLPGAQECADIGAAALLHAAEPQGGALAKRARLVFPRTARHGPVADVSMDRGVLMASAVARSLQIQPSWRWLFS